MKFVRRHDLDVEKRIDIAIAAYLMQGVYGSITSLSRANEVSRLFIYQLLWAISTSLENTFKHPIDILKTQDLPIVDKTILILRLEGKCSIQAISSILEQLGYPFHSTGYISQRLSFYANKLKNTLNTQETIKFVIYLSDEIFSGAQPILITIEPKSTAILSIELASKRGADSWKEHFLTLEKNGYFCLYLVSDKAKGLTSGFNEACPQREWQSDFFHELRDIIHHLFTLEKKAYAAIEEEYQRENVLDSARSDEVINKRIEQYELARKETETLIQLYEQYAYLCKSLKELFILFDANGNLKSLNYLYDEIDVIFELMTSLDYQSIIKEVESMRKRKDSLFVYFEKLSHIINEISPSVGDKEALQSLCLAWQYNHLSYLAKTVKRKEFLLNERNFYLSYAESLLNDNYQQSKELIFSQLDNVIRSSSLVETINSIIRPYLNSCKGNVTQDALNLIMFYHNHRRFVDGKRKGNAPIEILTGKKLTQYWVDLLTEQSS